MVKNKEKTLNRVITGRENFTFLVETKKYFSRKLVSYVLYSKKRILILYNT